MPATPTTPPPPGPVPRRRLLARTRDRLDARFVAEALRAETVGGVLLLLAAAVALLWANSPWRGSYESLKQVTVGPAALHLQLDLAHWASDGLLAVFFFVAGLELKRELVVGDLSEVQRAVLPVVAALSGVVVPAVLYLVVSAGVSGAARGWAVPTATDIAFALAALAVMGSHLPSALRAFLLTLAVVDDVVAITIIAVAYTANLEVVPLLAALVPIAVFGVLARRRLGRWWLLLPLAVVAWALVHASGVHATVAGVLLALTVPVHCRPDERESPAEHLEHAVRPFSAGFAVPAFALLAAGVTLVGGGLASAARDRVVWAVVVALVVGKAVGVFTGTWLTARFTRAQLDDDLEWGDVAGLSLLAGIGFTVSLLIGELAFGAGSQRDAHVKTGVLAASVLAAVLAAVVLRRRDRIYRRIAEAETAGGPPDDVADDVTPPAG